MKLYIKQRVFTWGDKFSVYDELGNEKYYVEGEVFTFGKKLHIMDTRYNELAFIHQKVFSFQPTYYISRGGYDVAQVVKEFTFFKHEYRIDGLEWRVSGDFFDHDFAVYDGERFVAQVFKEWFSWGDAYAIDIDPSADEINALAVAIVIDAVISDQRD